MVKIIFSINHSIVVEQNGIWTIKKNQVHLRSIAREIFSKKFFSFVSLPLFIATL